MTHPSGSVLQYVQIGLALLIAWLVWENSKTQMGTLDEKHREIIALLNPTP